jgi:isopentenyl-diphosphate Delta-isomerase
MEIILVDKDDNQIGTCEKIEAHRKALLHRAFSIFIFNSKKELLMQKRSGSKYHSPLKWSNTCCSHPLTDNIQKEARSRLRTEMGLDCDLEEAFTFIYKAKVEKLFEHELDHVFIGHSDQEPRPDNEEVADWKWMNITDLKKDIEKNQNAYTPWLRLCLDDVVRKLG